MSSFEHYRRTQVDMLHLVAHLMRLHRVPGHSESTPQQREVYDHIHHHFLETLQLTYARLEGIDQAPPGDMSQSFALQRRKAKPHKDGLVWGQARRWGAPGKPRRTSRPAPVDPRQNEEPFASDSHTLVHPAPRRLQ